MYLDLIFTHDTWWLLQLLLLVEWSINRPDLSQFSYGGYLGGDERKHLRYVPNADHSLAGTDAISSVASYYYGTLNNIELPIYNFSAVYGDYGAQLTLTIKNGKKPTSVLLWEAFSNTRDFRVETIGKTWKSTPVEINEELTWTIFVKNPPSSGYLAFLLEMTFDKYFKIPISLPLIFTTSTYIVPNTLPCKYPY